MTTDDLHEWLSFDYAGETYMLDLTFLSSRWSCIYGNGCPGIDDKPAPELEIGCCSHGAYFSDKPDRKRTRELMKQLGDDEWQYKDRADEEDGPIYKNEDGDWVTRVVDGACIFQNRADFPAGAGCAFHTAALNRGERFIDWKPSVCWQAPLRLDYHIDDNDHTTNILREWKRRDWGEGGADFHWWCTEDSLAFVGAESVHATMKDEIIEMIGEAPYGRLVEHFETQGTEHLLPHPARKKRDSNTKG